MIGILFSLLLLSFFSSPYLLFIFILFLIYYIFSYISSPSNSEPSGKVNDLFRFLDISTCCYEAFALCRSINLSKSSTCLNIFLYFLLTKRDCTLLIWKSFHLEKYPICWSIRMRLECCSCFWTNWVRYYSNQ